MHKTCALFKKLRWLFLSLLLFGVYYPGAMTADSVSQLTQARLKSYNDWHPPLMSWVWGWLDMIWAGPPLMLALNITLFVYSLKVFFDISKKIATSSIILSLFFLPTISALLGIVWKDVTFAFLNFAATGLLIREFHSSNQNYRSFALVIFMLFAATGLRHNGIPAVFVLSLLLFKVYSPQQNPILQIIMSTVLCVVFMGAHGLLNQRFFHVEKTFPVQQILMHDLAAIGRTIDLEPEFRAVNLSELSRTKTEFELLYNPSNVVQLYCCHGDRPYLKLVNESHKRFLVNLWSRVAFENIELYFKHRLRVLSELLGHDFKKQNCYAFDSGIAPNTLGLTDSDNPAKRLILRIFRKLENYLFFSGYAWILLNIALIVCFFCKNSRPRLVHLVHLAPALSGLFYTLPYVFVATTCDFRMLYWTALGTLTSIVLFLMHHRGQRHTLLVTK